MLDDEGAVQEENIQLECNEGIRISLSPRDALAFQKRPCEGLSFDYVM